MNVDNIPVI